MYVCVCVSVYNQYPLKRSKLLSVVRDDEIDCGAVRVGATPEMVKCCCWLAITLSSLSLCLSWTFSNSEFELEQNCALATSSNNMYLMGLTKK